MRTHPTRPFLFVALLVALTAATALAQQPVVRGKVVDESGKPIPGADLMFTARFQALTRPGKTDSKGEFLVVGLPSGDFEVTAKKEGVGEDTIRTRITQGQNVPITLTLRPAAPAAAVVAPPPSASAAATAAAQTLQALAKTASEHLSAGRNDEAIAAFTEVVGKAPTCADCFFNLGVGHANKKQYSEAEAAFKKAIEVRPDHVNAHTQLAAIYNMQKKYDLAAEASANAAKYSAAAPGATGGSTEALYNQGVTLFNGGKFPEAKAAFEAATKADPKNAQAHYQLGMTAVNLGDFNTAVSALERYLAIEPNGPKAAEVKGSLPTLRGMIKK